MKIRSAVCLATTLALAAGCGADPASSLDLASTASSPLHGHRGHRGKKCKIKCKDSTDCLLKSKLKNLRPFKNPNGAHATLSTAARRHGHLDTDNPFFKSIGTNGRACVTCHTPEDAWGLSVANIRERFEDSCGTDALFRTVDGSNSPDADVSTLEKKREAYSLLLNRGLIRIQIPIPEDAEFELVSADDPYGNSTDDGISVFRRPLAATNLKFINLVMSDGREPNLRSQALNATLGHAEASSAPSDATLDAIVAFETSLFTTQTVSKGPGSTSADGAGGDPDTLASQPFLRDGNNPVFTPPGTPPFYLDTFSTPPEDPNVFTIYEAWASAGGRGHRAESRRSVARGEALFNTRFFQIDEIPGLGPLQATCSTCHNAANAGGATQATIVSKVGVHALLTDVNTLEELVVLPDLPVYTFREKATGRLVKSTDPGAALTTGKIADFGAFKPQGLRGVSGRAPYFHNGSAATLGDVVDFYDDRFDMGLSAQERDDLLAFLKTL